MLRNIIFAILIIISYLIETTFGNVISLAGIIPNLVLIVVCMFALLRGKKAGLILGFFAGLLIDIFYGYFDVIGINALLYMYIGFINGIFNDIIYIKNYHIPVIAVGLSDLSYSLCYYFVTYMLRNKLNFGYYFGHIIVPEMVYTIFCTVIIFKFILWINSKIDDFEKRRETSVD